MTALADRLRSALASGTARATELLESDMIDILPPGAPPSPAAVLVAVTDRAKPGLLFIQRTETMRAHPGQIAFPGGRIDPGDDGPIGAALREAEEEIGLPPAAVTVIGATDLYRTVTGFHVTPVIGVVAPDLPLVANAHEVAAWFEAPLGFVLDPANHVRRSAEWRGRERHYIEILWEGRRIWGATAAMIVNLSRRLAWAS